MDDNTKKNSWDDLLQDLGAKPDESAFERHQAPAQEIPPTVEWSEAEELVEETKASPGDWNSLADSLGLEVEDSPKPADEPVAAKAEPPVVTKAEKKPAPEKTTSEKTAPKNQPFGGFAAPEESSLEDTSEVDDEYDYEDDGDNVDELPPLPNQVDQALSETAWDDETEEEQDEAAAEDETGEGISGEAARSAFDALFSEGATGWGSAFIQKPKKDDSMRAAKGDGADRSIADGVADSVADSELSESLDAKTDSEGDDEESERPKRKRSRRRRRGGRGRKSGAKTGDVATGDDVAVEGEASDEQASADRDGESSERSTEGSTEESSEGKKRRPRRRRSGQKSRPVEASEGSDFDEDSMEDGGDDTDPDQPRAERGRELHRNLPTWSEAIGIIVDTNLEQRAKSPSKPQSSRGGRGGRGRRGGRGQRSKSSENSN